MDSVLAPSAIDLCSVEQILEWLNTTDSPASDGDAGNIQLCITAASMWWLWSLGLGNADQNMPDNSPLVEPVDYDEFYDGAGGIQQFLRVRPIVSVSLLTIGPITVPLSQKWGVPGYVISQNRKSLQLRGGGGLANGGGLIRVGFNNLCGGGGAYGNGGGGLVFAYGVQNVHVQYQAGFQATPTDITLAVIQQVAVNYKRKSWIDQKSQAMAEGAGTVSYRDWMLPKEILMVMDNYRRRAIV